MKNGKLNVSHEKGKQFQFEESSGNVFADLGLENADELKQAFPKARRAPEQSPYRPKGGVGKRFV